MLFKTTLNVTKSYTYLGHIITDNFCDESDIKSKVGCLYARSNILLRKFYFCRTSEFYIICIMRCSASFMFANTGVDSCSRCITKSIFS